MVSDFLIRFIYTNYTPLFAWIGRRVNAHTSSVLQVQQLHTADIPSEAYLLPIPKEHKLYSPRKWHVVVCRVTGMRSRTPGVVTHKTVKSSLLPYID